MFGVFSLQHCKALIQSYDSTDTVSCAVLGCGLYCPIGSDDLINIQWVNGIRFLSKEKPRLKYWGQLNVFVPDIPFCVCACVLVFVHVHTWVCCWCCCLVVYLYNKTSLQCIVLCFRSQKRVSQPRLWRQRGCGNASSQENLCQQKLTDQHDGSGGGSKSVGTCLEIHCHIHVVQQLSNDLALDEWPATLHTLKSL